MNFLPLIILFLIEGPIVIKGQSSNCEELAKNAILKEKLTVVDTNFKTLAGIWLSEGCETRPGPEYLLRYYLFGKDGNYRLIQHHYRDSSCSSPKYTIVSMGHLKIRRDSIYNHDAVSGLSKALNISIIPHDFKATQELEALVSHHCPGRHWKSWRRYEEHTVYSHTKFESHKLDYSRLPLETKNYHNGNTQHHLHNDSGDISCLGHLRWTFNELKLIKVQLRPTSNPIASSVNEIRWELLLGDIPSDLFLLKDYTPTAYQVPLLKHTKTEPIFHNERKYLVRQSCGICGNLIKNEKVPPHLMKKAQLPPYIWGEWISERCEVQPLGLYLMRRFSFYNESLWVTEQKFFSDSKCTKLKFVVTASGLYGIGNLSDVLEGANDIDFMLEQANLVVYDRYMLSYMQNSKCGEDLWRIGVSQELKGNCYQLHIFIPSTQYDVVKLDMNYDGLWLLLLGQINSNSFLKSKATNRPTSFDSPLLKCTNAKIITSAIESAYYFENILYNQSKKISISNSSIIVLLVTSFYLKFK